MKADVGIDIDVRRCIGSGQCVLIAPDIFTQSPVEGTVRLLIGPPLPRHRLRTVEEAVAQCPVGALNTWLKTDRDGSEQS